MAKQIKPRPLSEEQKQRVAAADYDVGFGKPSKDTQFRPGQSGNPRGRPKGAKSLRVIMSDLLEQPVTVGVNGQSKQITAKQAIAQRLVIQALTGKTQDAALFLQLIKQVLPEEFAEEITDELSGDEALIVEGAIEKTLLARKNVGQGNED